MHTPRKNPTKLDFECIAVMDLQMEESYLEVGLRKEHMQTKNQELKQVSAPNSWHSHLLAKTKTFDIKKLG